MLQCRGGIGFHKVYEPRSGVELKDLVHILCEIQYQCCNVAVVLDFTKYMNQILELNTGSRFARVQPGVVLDSLRNGSETHQLTFAPDPSTHNRCTIGGMIGNNSCGTHSLLGGKTVDNVESLRILLYDGTVLTVGDTSEMELQQILAAGGRPGEIYSELRRIGSENAK